MIIKENKNAFKHWIGPDVINQYAEGLAQVLSHFNKKEFLVLKKKIVKLELKERVQVITLALEKNLPQDYQRGLPLLAQLIKKTNMKGFALWPISFYIQKNGLSYLKLSLDTLYELTPLFSSEFAIRPYINLYPEKVFKQFSIWAKDPNVHIRRWVSEGTRPRLPWGEKLDSLIKNPDPSIALLELLKYDSQLYVRKSVANHLNDISKDHPDLVIKTLRNWKKSCPDNYEKEFYFITYHALRTLIKKGDEEALGLIGIKKNNTSIKLTNFSIDQKIIKLNDSIQINSLISNSSSSDVKVAIDYIINYCKKNGETSPKVYKLKNTIIKKNSTIDVKKMHHLKKVTTRVHYNGVHSVQLQINGVPSKKLQFELTHAGRLFH